MKKLLGGLLSCILGGWLLTACTSDDDLQQIPEGKGYVKLALNTNTGFQTKNWQTALTPCLPFAVTAQRLFTQMTFAY